MDGEKKKRKMGEAGADEGEDEAEKIEKFFALIKSTREVRERLVGAPAEKRPAPPWNPTFVLEDFLEAPPPEVEKEGTSAEGDKEKEKEKEKEVSGGKKKGLELDLNLSL